MRAADLIVKLLKNQGVETIFGFPGGAIMPLYDAIYDSGLKHVLARHEQGAAFSAIGYARTSGKTGVCLSTSGPGATNLITGLADALLDSVPMVVITGQVASELVGTDAFQEVDVLGLSLSVTKHSFIVTDPAELNQTIPEAFLLANEGRPGHVLIDIPRDVQLGSVQFVPFLTPTSQLPKPGDEKILRARKMLKTAKRPLLYVGGGVGMACAVDLLRDFQSQTRMPSVSTLKGIGTL
ncbi:MAG: acetolactate synthase large subunit, partial [Deltaproteobacteria bacterium]|nr:acetolactate synthase large subunit [Deltaproteobacteria bacterium]